MANTNAPNVNEQAAAKAVNAAVPAGMLDPATLQVLMATMMEGFRSMNESNREMFLEGIQKLREPTPEEKAKLQKEIDRIKQARITAAETGKQIAAIEARNQANCAHLKPNGMHTFVGQVLSDGWARISCVRCNLAFRVKPLPDHIASGLQLEGVKGLTVEHLQKWQEQSGLIEQRLIEQAVQQANLRKQVSEPLAAA